MEFLQLPTSPACIRKRHEPSRPFSSTRRSGRLAAFIQKKVFDPWRQQSPNSCTTIRDDCSATQKQKLQKTFRPDILDNGAFYPQFRLFAILVHSFLTTGIRSINDNAYTKLTSWSATSRNLRGPNGASPTKLLFANAGNSPLKLEFLHFCTFFIHLVVSQRGHQCTNF
ncbi:uncharacterized protein K452DRAFT_283243 [Aplosporella prunicola CBS 121167]|uniref:Uncharacterized protein n=1 Tax=Aplosporella prunicola CBS 121167 TaxID=1176127 RepID=A0A6A6BPF1_9PEZI|nr:uncharacterized protein K452DRAFT_283243 [Aplosporella prunicola CBS 121167]KAF2145946.1 hypothetical protein K452DRAFT_283243 [Aplosporella prunicola CBS 121167]